MTATVARVTLAADRDRERKPMMLWSADGVQNTANRKGLAQLASLDKPTVRVVGEPYISGLSSPFINQDIYIFISAY